MGNLEGILRDFFNPTKEWLKTFEEHFGAFFVRKLLAQKNIICAKIRSADVSPYCNVMDVKSLRKPVVSEKTLYVIFLKYTITSAKALDEKMPRFRPKGQTPWHRASEEKVLSLQWYMLLYFPFPEQVGKHRGEAGRKKTPTSGTTHGKYGNQKPGDHPNFRKNALGVKRPFSELSESSGVFSEQLSECEIPFSEYEIPFSEWHLAT